MPRRRRKSARWRLFCSLTLSGSTELADASDPERTRALLVRFYESMTVEIDRVGGTVEKFVGDAVMASFGAPAAHDVHFERALHAALAMQRRLGELFGHLLAFRIGVNTGEVVVGRPREGSSFVTGDAVNVGARLEQAAAPGQILVGERAVLAARGAFEFGEPVTIQAKGSRTASPAAGFVRALVADASAWSPGLSLAFVGREAELPQLQAAYRRCRGRTVPRIWCLFSVTPARKTQLFRELWEWFAALAPRAVAPHLALPFLRPGHHLLVVRRRSSRSISGSLRAILPQMPSPSVLANHPSTRPLPSASVPPADLHPLVGTRAPPHSWVELPRQISRRAADRRS